MGKPIFHNWSQDLRSKNDEISIIVCKILRYAESIKFVVGREYTAT